MTIVDNGKDPAADLPAWRCEFILHKSPPETESLARKSATPASIAIGGTAFA